MAFASQMVARISTSQPVPLQARFLWYSFLALACMISSGTLLVPDTYADLRATPQSNAGKKRNGFSVFVNPNKPFFRNMRTRFASGRPSSFLNSQRTQHHLLDENDQKVALRRTQIQ
mmetsp:Transcript_2900/g.13549  ORF Transcript_2900/g.13549 Transcript_2900/m.13549 type:complete len:117 (-) Transcript_2900:2038-2388(-)